MEQTRTHAEEANTSIAKNVISFADEVTERSNCVSDNVTVLLKSIRERSEAIQAAVEENENVRKNDQNNQVNVENTFAQNLRDRLGKVNKEMLAMVEENYLSPKKTGKTPLKSHYSVPKDSEIPPVPKKEKILASNGLDVQTPRRSTTRTRESLLEVQNICLSPDTLAAARKSRLEDIGEESSISLSNRANSESLKEGQEN
ncbi:hypothetical protein OSTOST_12146 [Ostertagia ostertagi]